MIIIKNQREIGLMAEAGKIVAACHRALRDVIRPGISTLEIDRFVEDFITRHGASAAQKGYRGYPFATCASVNDEICHGFPTQRVLQEGDIVGIDFVVNLNGWMADSAWTYPVGEISPAAKKLLQVTKECLYLGIEQAVVGKRTGDIGHAIQTHAEAQGFSVVRDFAGHGIGRSMHEDPQILHFGRPGRGLRLREGLAFTIEPMINAGTWQLSIDDNNWTARTLDGKLSAQYEHTLVVTEHGPLILTEQD
jgi:methionyl aminopeptidase